MPSHQHALPAGGWPAGRELIRAVMEFASAPRVTPAYVSVVHNGQVVVDGWLPGRPAPAGAAGALAQRARPGTPPPAHRGAPYGTGWTSLTEAELRVVRLVVSGLTNREVASRLYLSWHTVNSHLRHVLQKLGLHSRVDLTRVALQHDPGLAA